MGSSGLETFTKERKRKGSGHGMRGIRGHGGKVGGECVS